MAALIDSITIVCVCGWVGVGVIVWECVGECGCGCVVGVCGCDCVVKVGVCGCGSLD